MPELLLVRLIFTSTHTLKDWETMDKHVVNLGLQSLRNYNMQLPEVHENMLSYVVNVNK